MTVSTAPTPLTYNGNGSTTAFPITWKYNATSHVVATLRSSAGVETVWVLTTNYTLTAAGDSGTLTAVVAPATGETLVITLEPPNTQSSDIPLGGDLPSTTLEDSLDLSAQRDAKIESLFLRALRVPKTDTQTGSLLELPVDSLRASKFLSFDANGKPIAAAGTSANLGPVSTFVNTLLDDTDSTVFTATVNANFTGTNTALGGSALDSNTTGTNNSAFGLNALTANTGGGSNTAVGANALDVNTSGGSNTAVGLDALGANTTASSNTAVGRTALAANTTGTGNTAVGRDALGANTTANNSTAVGMSALILNTTGTSNTAVGQNALQTNTTGGTNVAVGIDALGANTTAANNVAVGASALSLNTTAANNVAVGSSALAANTTGTGNTAVGRSAVSTNTTANNNTGVGLNALLLSTGADNTAVGAAALDANTTGAGNVAVGTDALTDNTTGGNNIAIGNSALAANTTATSNVAVGRSALAANTTGLQNTALGDVTGSTVTTGSNLTMLGFDAEPTSATATNEITLGNASVATLRCQVTTITALSDARDKKDVQDIGLGLSFVQKLKPIKFKWAMRDGTEKPDQFEPGFVAQDFQQVQIEENAEWMGLVYESNPDKLEATPGKLLPVLVRAIQELASENKSLRAGIDALSCRIG